MNWILSVRATIKIFLQLVIVCLFILASLSVRLFVYDKIRRRHIFATLTTIAARMTVRLMGIRLQVKGLEKLQNKNYLLVANHTGFIDIFSLASVCPSLFITSQDMRETPGLGLVTEMAGCLYVERRNRSNIHQEILVIREALKQGFNVMLYPEATATSGEKIYPFKKTLLTAAAGTGVEIFPVVVNFRKINDEPMSDKWRDSVFWYGDLTFLHVGLRAYALKSLDIEIEFLEPILCQTEQDRHEVAGKAQRLIEEKYNPILFPI